MAEKNNDILEVFEMVGTVAIDLAEAFKGLTDLEGKGEQTTQRLEETFEDAFRRISALSASPDLDVNSEAALSEIRIFKDQFSKLLDGLEADPTIDFDTDPAVKELQALRQQAEALEQSFSGTEGSIEVDAVQARQTLVEMQQRAEGLRETLQDQRYDITIRGEQAQSTLQQLIGWTRDLDGALNRLRDNVIRIEKFITETVERVVQTTYTTAGDPGMVGPQVTPSGDAQSNGPPNDYNYPPSGNPADDPNLTAAHAAAAAGMTAVGAAGANGARRLGNFAYDLQRADRALEAYQRRMLQYAMKLDPKNVLQRVTMRLDVASDMFEYFPNSKNMMMLQATFSAIEQGALAARRQLSQLGFGRTKTEIKALEGQMHSMANIRLDNLRDQIKLTEKALNDMKKSANADQFVEEMAEAERALKRYKDELAKSNPVDVIAKANGYEAGKLFGKDVIYKPFDNAMDALTGRIVQFVNKDLAYLQNKTYEALENSAKAIVGPQSTKMEEKAKIQQLIMKYQQLGMMINTFVTPAVVALGVAFGAVAVAAQKGWGVFEAQTLSSMEDMKDFKNIMADTAASTGTSIEEVGKLFSVLSNQMGRTKDNIQESAEWGLQFQKAWGTDAVEAIAAVDDIAKELGVTQKEATDILALAMKKHQGDLEKATKDVKKNEEAWKKNGKTMTDGMTAYEKMVSGLDDNGIAKSEQAFRKLGNSLLELWKALEPTVIKLADALSAAADTATAFLRNNPGMATFLAHMIAIGGASIVLLGVLAPIAGFLLMYRGLFQALGQALGFAGKGMVVMSPAARMLYDNLMLTRNAVAGLPRMFRALGPGLLSFFRGLPAMVGGFVLQFIKLNPILSGIAAISWVIYKNWDRFQPVLASIWDSLKRIGNAVIQAFAGPGQTGAEGFSMMMDKLAKLLGDVLLPIFEVLAKVLEVVAALMETGAGKYLVYAVAIGMMTGALGNLIPGVGLLSSALKLLTGNTGKATGALGLLKKAFSGIGGAAVGLGPILAKMGGGLLTGVRAMVGGVGGVLARFGAMLLPLLTNPWVLGIAAIVAVVAGLGYLVYKHWDQIVAKTKQIFGGIASWFKSNWKTLLFAGLGGPLGALGKYLYDHWDSISKNAKKAGSKIASWFKSGLSGIGSAFSGLGPKLKRAFSNMWSDFKGMVSRNLRALNRTWSWQFNNLWKALGPIGKFLKEAFTGIFKGFPIIAGRIFTAVGRTIANRIRKYAQIITAGLRGAGRLFANGWKGAQRATSAAFSFVRRVVSNGMKSAGKAVSDAFRSIRRAFSTGISFIRRLASSGFSFIRRTISNAMSAAGRIISDAWAKIRRLFSSAISALRRAASAGFNAIRRAIASAMSATARAISDAWSKIRRYFSNALSALRRAVSEGFSAMRRAISSALGAISRNVSQIWSRIRQTIGNALNAVRRGVASAFQYVYNTIKNKISAAYRSITGTFGRIGRFFKGIAKSAFSWGSDIVGGIVSGISGRAKRAYDAVAKVGKGIASAFKKAMGIASPSRIMRVLSRWVPVGAAKGIEDGIPDVEGATGKMVDAATPEYPDVPGPNPPEPVSQEYGAPLPPDTFGGAGTFRLDPVVTGNPAELLAQSMRNTVAPTFNMDSTINTATRLKVETEQKAQIYNVQKLEPHIHVQQLATQEDYAKIRRDTQRYMVDETNKEVNRRQ